MMKKTEYIQHRNKKEHIQHRTKKKKWISILMCFVLCMGMCLQWPCQIMTAHAESGVRDLLHCTILGDSIAKGYSGDKSVWIECYGRIAAKQIASEDGRGYRVVNYAKTGLDSEGINEKVLPRKAVKKNLEKSDIIFITIGSNDLLNECKRVVQQILNTDTKFKSADEALAVLQGAVKENPLLILKIMNALSNWNYESFESQWLEMFDTINELRQEDTAVIVTTIYNPVANRKLPSTMNNVVEEIIGNMNQMIRKHAAQCGYEVADLLDSTVSAHVQEDGVHPDQAGQHVIAGIVKEKYREQDTK